MAQRTSQWSILQRCRAIPGLVVLRPGDANEVREAWKLAVERRDGPTVLVFSRQNAPTLDRSIYAPAVELRRGAYVLADLGDYRPELILMASGTELGLVVTAAERLAAEGVNVRLVSVPSWELFEAQDLSYREFVLPPGVHSRIAVEAGISMGWDRWVGERGAIIAVDRFGASAPQNVVYEQYGLSVSHIMERALALLS